MSTILSINNQIYNKKIIRLKQFYLSLFFVSIIICIIISLYFYCSYYNKIIEVQKTNLFKNKYTISTLYSASKANTSLKLSNNISVIGSIKIPQVNISYPIIENTNDVLLKISVCRFSGPLPNRIGNLCIVGHNYKNNTMFSNLHKLNIGDYFYITDLNNTKLKYIVYKKYVVQEENLSCTENSNNLEVTLITCHNNDNSKRLVIKAKMEG